MEARTSHHNEAFERDGAPRAFYRPLLEAMEDLGPEALAEKRARAGERLGELGATFPLPDTGGEEDRVLPAPARKRATARESSPPNYHQITEAVDGLKYRIESVCPNGASTSTVENRLDEASKRLETLRTRTSVGDAGFNSTEDLLPANSNSLA